MSHDPISPWPTCFRLEPCHLTSFMIPCNSLSNLVIILSYKGRKQFYSILMNQMKIFFPHKLEEADPSHYPPYQNLAMLLVRVMSQRSRANLHLIPTKQAASLPKSFCPNLLPQLPKSNLLPLMAKSYSRGSFAALTSQGNK